MCMVVSPTEFWSISGDWPCQNTRHPPQKLQVETAWMARSATLLQVGHCNNDNNNNKYKVRETCHCFQFVTLDISQLYTRSTVVAKAGHCPLRADWDPRWWRRAFQPTDFPANVAPEVGRVLAVKKPFCH